MNRQDLGRKGGVKRPILYIAVAFSLGIISSHYLKIPVFYPFVFSIAFLASTILFQKKAAIAHVSLYLAILCLGMAYFKNAEILPPAHISYFLSEEPKSVFVKGIIVNDPVTNPTFYKNDKTTFTLNVNSLKDNGSWQKACGLAKVELYSEKGKALSFGDEVSLEGIISKPAGLRNPGLFNYSEYLGIKGIYAALKVRDGMRIEIFRTGSSNYLKKTAYGLRHKIRHLLDERLEKPYNDFLKAILIGERAGFDDDITEDFVKTGTVHILAISGLHVGLVAGIVLALFSMLGVPKKPNLVLTLIFLTVYSFMAGSNPPIIRAVIIFAIFTIGYLMNRDSDMLNSLSFAAVLILLWNPKELFDPSFQLSFVSVASIVIFVPAINSLFMAEKFRDKTILFKSIFYVLTGASVSIAAWLGTWPITARYFNIISPIAIIANLIVIPVLFLITASSFLLFLFGAIPIAAALLGKWLSLIIAALFSVNHALAGLHFAYFRIPSPSICTTLLYYALIFILISKDGLRINKFNIRKNILLMCILAALNILIWNSVSQNGKDALEVTFLDVGQGDSAFIRLPGGHNILIDGGSGGEEGVVDAGKSVVAPYLWNKGVFDLDAVVVTHFHDDHLGGILYVLKNFKVGCVIDNGTEPQGSRLYGEYVKLVRKNNIRRYSVGDGDVIMPSKDAEFFVLNPENREDAMDSNENSIAMKFLYKNFSILFCADITSVEMTRILDSYLDFLKSDIIKVPHHGGNVGSEIAAENFFRAASPEVYIISVGKTNRYNISSKRMHNVIASFKSICYDTTNNGAVIVSTKSGSFKAKPFVDNN